MKKVLIADQDEALKEAFRLVFPKDEYQIIYSMSAKEVIKMAKEEKPQVFILNMDLLDIKGLDVLKTLKNDKEFEESKFYLLRNEERKGDVIQYEVDGIIDKPINYLTVHQMLLGDTKEPDVYTQHKRKKEIDDLLQEFSKTELQKKLFNLKDEIESITKEVVIDAQRRLSEKLEPILKDYLEWYVELKLPEIAEKILKEKIEKIITLLKK
ncbi:MAG: response regulator [Deltaproteobacteria bacterium]|nr:response regulator [Deltaproteobacteria bacterium]